jgi:hypothetical protein
MYTATSRSTRPWNLTHDVNFTVKRIDCTPPKEGNSVEIDRFSAHKRHSSELKNISSVLERISWNIYREIQLSDWLLHNEFPFPPIYIELLIRSIATKSHRGATMIGQTHQMTLRLFNISSCTQMNIISRTPLCFVGL